MMIAPPFSTALADRLPSARIFWLSGLTLLYALFATPVTAQQAPPGTFLAPHSMELIPVPGMRPYVVIGPSYPAPHFSAAADPMFLTEAGGTAPQAAAPRPVSVEVITDTRPGAHQRGAMTQGQAAVAGVLSMGVISLIQRAEREANENSSTFGVEVYRRVPDFNPALNFNTLLQNCIEAHDIKLEMLPAPSATGPRPLLPLPAGEQKSGADAPDLTVAVSAFMVYSAPVGPAVYRRGVSVWVSVYDGHTHHLLAGKQFRFKPTDSNFEYMRYDDLVKDLPNAAQALNDALLSLAPAIADYLAAGTAP